MNFGTSVNGRRARDDGRGPASWCAAAVGHGVAAAWIKHHLAPSEWHHSQAGLGGDGAPVDYFDRGEVLAAWLAANWAAARAGNDTARRRLPELRQLRRAWEVEPASVREAMERPCPLPEPAAVSADPLVGRWIRATRTTLERTHNRARRYQKCEEALLAWVQAASATMLTVIDWQTGQKHRVARHTLHGLAVL